MKNKFGIFIFSILFSVNAYSFTTSDIVSIACSESSRAFGVLGVKIRDELVKIQKDSNLNSTQLELKIKSLQAEVKRMEGDIYQIISKERSELFKRFGSMIYVDMYILINSSTPTRSFIIAHDNSSLNANQLLPKLNSVCISEQLAGIEKARNNQR